MDTEDKPLIGLHGEIKTPPFSPLARIEAGVLLRRLQQGQIIPLPHSRPMPSIGPRCHELRIHDIDATWRIIDRLDFDAVIIGEVFSKKTTKTPKKSSTSAKDGFKNMMNEAKKKHLIEKGWKIGSVEEFLQLSPDEAAYVELRLKLSDSLRIQRQKKNLTQVELAKRVKSSQSRVAKMEAGDSSISLDLLIRSLLALGASNRDLANMIGQDYHGTAG